MAGEVGWFGLSVPCNLRRHGASLRYVGLIRKANDVNPLFDGGTAFMKLIPDFLLPRFHPAFIIATW